MTGSDIERELAKLRKEFEAFRDSIQRYGTGIFFQGGPGDNGRKGGNVTFITGSKKAGVEGGQIIFVDADTGRKLQLDFDTKTFKEMTE